MLATPEVIESLPTHLQTVDEFEAWERQPGHDGSYEFVRGRIMEKDIPIPNRKEVDNQATYLLVKFLTRLFTSTAAYQQGDELTPEMDSYVDEVRNRRPDLGYFTLAQILATRSGARQKTSFAIEILSDSETHKDVLEKIQDYFDGGAELLWYIIPKRQKIYVYTSPDDIKVYKNADVISAAPLLPDFQFSVADLFA